MSDDRWPVWFWDELEESCHIYMACCIATVKFYPLHKAWGMRINSIPNAWYRVCDVTVDRERVPGLASVKAAEVLRKEIANLQFYADTFEYLADLHGEGKDVQPDNG